MQKLAAGGDAHRANRSLLLHMEGANGGTSFTDSSANGFTGTPTSATTSTTQAKYGSSSLSVGRSGRVSIPSNAAFDFATGDFFLGFWCYFNSVAGEQWLTTRGGISASSTTGPFAVILVGGNIGFYSTANNLAWDIANNLLIKASPSSGAWNHIGAARIGNNFYTYWNGAQVSTVSSSSSLYANGAAVSIGNDSNNSSAKGANAYIDEFTLVKGSSAGATSSTCPTTAILDF
jgi:hypothetical protein